MATQKQWEEFLKKINGSSNAKSSSVSASEKEKEAYRQKLISESTGSNSWVSPANANAYKASMAKKSQPVSASTTAPVSTKGAGVVVPSAKTRNLAEMDIEQLEKTQQAYMRASKRTTGPTSKVNKARAASFDPAIKRQALLTAADETTEKTQVSAAKSAYNPKLTSTIIAKDNGRNAGVTGVYQQNADLFNLYDALNTLGVVGGSENPEAAGTDLYTGFTIPGAGNYIDNTSDIRDFHMTPEQLATFNYFMNYAKYEEARAYLADVRLGADVQWTENVYQPEMEQYAENNPVQAYMNALLSNVKKPVNAALQSVSALAGGNVSAYSPLYENNTKIATIRRTQSENIGQWAEQSDFGKWFDNTKLSEATGITAGGAARFLYDTTSSMADNAVANAAAVITGQTWLPMAMMGSQAISDTMYGDLLKGKENDARLLLHAGFTGALEAVTEKLGIDALFGKPAGSVMKYLAKSGGAEALEEMISEVGSIAWDHVANEGGDFWLSVAQYADDGLPMEEAVRKATWDLAENIGLAGLSGGLSGIGQAGSQLAIPNSVRSIRMEGAQSLLERNEEIQSEIKQLEQKVEQGNMPEAEAENAKATIAALETEKKRNNEKVKTLVKKMTGETDEKPSSQQGSVSNPEVEKGITIKNMDKDGNFTLSDGSTRAYADVDMESMPQTEELASAALRASEDYGVSPGVYYGAYQDGKNVSQYNYAASAIMSAGYAGGSLDTVMARQNVADVVPMEMAKALYVAAANKGKQDISANRLNAKLASPLPTDGTVTVTEEARAELAKDASDSSRIKIVEAMTDMANAGVFKKFGLKVEFYASKADADGKYAAGQGSYTASTNTLRVDINAGRSSVTDTASYAVGQVVSHELTHFIRANSDTQYKALQSYVADALAKRGESLDAHVQQIRANYKARGKDLDLGDAMEEAVAQACEMALRDSQLAANLAKTDRTLAEKIRDFLKDLSDKIKAAFAGSRHITDMSKAMEQDMEGLVEIWDRALMESLEGNTEESAAGETVEAAINEATEGAVDANGDPLFSLRTMREDIDVYREMLTKHGQMTDEQVTSLVGNISKVMDYIDMHRMVLDFGENIDSSSRPFKPVKPNADPLYKVSVDFSTLCRKRLLQQSVQERLEQIKNKPLTKAERIAVRQALMELRKQGKQIEVACALCYVESTRLKAPQQIERFMKDRENILHDYFAAKDTAIKAAMDEYEAKKREELGEYAPLNALPESVAKKIRAAKKQALTDYKVNAEQQRIIDLALGMTVAEFTSADALWSLKESEPELFDCYSSYIRNATKSKGVEGDTPWKAGDSGSISDALIKNMNAENGMRSQSWSDFQAYHILDYVGAIIELSTRNAKMQSYTKVPDYIRLMGRTGMMINQSLIPAAKWSGKLEYDPIEGMDYPTALDLRDEYPDTAGTICIGINDEQIRLLLADDTIDMVIPYHKSSMDKVTRQKLNIPGWQDHEATQNEKAIPGKKAGKAPKFSEWFDYKTVSAIAREQGAQEAMQYAAQKYLDLCGERNLTPKFPQFSNEDNYWKLLIDRKMINQKTGEIINQTAVQPNFSLDDMLTVCQNEVERFAESNRDFQEASDAVVEMFLDGQISKVAKSQKVKDKLIAAENWMTVQAAVNSQMEAEEGVKYSFRGYAEDGRGKYEGNYPIGTPKAAKAKTLLQYIQNVWSKKPIPLVIRKNGTERTIYAQFDPTYSDEEGSRTDAAKMMWGLKAGSAGERRVTLDLADDYYKIASEATYSHSKEEEGKTTATHVGVKEWHYFVNEIYFSEYGKEEYAPYRVIVNVKEKDDGSFVYSFFAEKEKSIAPQTLNAAVSRGEPSTNDRSSALIVPQPSPYVNPESDVKSSLRTEAPLTDREIVGEAMESVAKNDAELAFLRKYQNGYQSVSEDARKIAEQRNIMAEAEPKSEEYNKAYHRANTAQNRMNRNLEELAKMEKNRLFKNLVRAEVERATQRVRAEENVKAALIRETEELRRSRLEEQIARKDERFRQYRADRKESATRQKYLDRIDREANTLTELLITNTDKKHVPEALKAPLGAFLSSLRRYSKTLHEEHKYTNKDLKLNEQLRRVQEVLRKQSLGAENVSVEGNLYLPDSVVDMVGDIIETMENYTRNNPDMDPVYSMDNKRLKNLSDVLTILRKAINNVNRTFANAQYAKIDTLGDNTYNYLTSMRRASDRNNKLTDHLNWEMLTPIYAFEKLGEAGQSIFKGLMDGYGRFSRRMNEIESFSSEHWNAKKVKDWGESVVERTFERVDDDGNEYTATIRMTQAQIMSLYLLSKREQAVKHIEGGGIKAATVRKGAKDLIYQSEAVMLSMDEVHQLTSALTAEQLKICHAIADFFKRTSDWGNEVSMERFGYKAFGELNYFPIVTDDTSRKAIDEKGKGGTDLYRLLNMSFTKALAEKTDNALVVDNIFTVFADHASDMAKYSTMALPVLDAIRWYNYGWKSKGDNQKSVRSAMRHAYKDAAEKYVQTFISDLSGVTRSSKRTHVGLDTLMRNAKIASVAANFNVIAQQGTSILRAMYAMPSMATHPWRTFTPKTLAGFRSNYAEMLDHSGIALWKSMGYYDTNVGRPLEQRIAKGEGVVDKLVDIASWGAETVDKLTFTTIWNAAKADVKGRKNGPKEGTQEYWAAVTDLFENVIYKTQVVDGVMNRSHQMRSPDSFDKIITSFMAEPVLSYNVAHAALSDAYRNKRIHGHVGWKNMWKILGTTATVMSANVVAGIIKSFFSALRDEDDYATFAEKLEKQLLGDGDTWYEKLLSSGLVDAMNPFGWIPIINNAVDMFKGEESTMAGSAINYIQKAWKEIQKLYEGSSTANPVKTGTYIVRAFSYVSGLPFYSLGRDLIAVWNSTIGTSNPNLKLRTYGSTASEGYEAYYDAILAGDTAEMKRLEKVMKLNKTQSGKTHYENLSDNLAKIVKEEYLAGALPFTKAEEILIKYCGRTETGTDSAYHDITAWEYKAATGATSYSMYEPLKTALLSGDDKDVEEAVEALKTHYKKSDKEIKSETATIVREAMQNGEISRKEAEKIMDEYTDKNRDEIDEYLAGAKVYNPLLEAVLSGSTSRINAAFSDLDKTYGISKDEAKKNLPSTARSAYKDGKITAEEAYAILDKYTNKTKDEIYDYLGIDRK